MAAGSTVIPRELPDPDQLFVDREAELDSLRSLVEAAARAGRCAYAHVHGLSGVGKTALVLRAAAMLRGAFPDGDVWLKRSNVDAGVSDHASAYLREALMSFGHSAEELGGLADDPNRLAGALRTVMAERRALILVDDAVRPAITEYFRFRSPGSLVVVTSRDRWEVLPSEYAPIPVRRLASEDAGQLVDRWMDRREVSCPAAVRDALVAGTGGLPLLIGIGSQAIADLPADSVRAQVELLESALGDDPVGEICGISYAELSRADQRAYRMLSLLHPVPGFEPQAAGALLDLPLPETTRILRELRAKNLLGISKDRRLYRFEDTIWKDANRRRNLADGPDECRQAIGRMLRWYLEKLVSYEKVLSGRWRIAGDFARVPPVCDPADRQACKVARQEGLRWMERLRQALAALVTTAHSFEFDDHAWALCEALWSLLHQHNHLDEWEQTHQIGLLSARRANRPLAVMHLSLQLGTALLRRRKFSGAAECFEEGYGIAVAEDHVFGIQSGLEWKARVQLELGAFEDAVRLYDESMAVARSRLSDESERLRALALGHFHRGRAYHRWGRIAEAAADLSAAADHFRTVPADADNYAKALHAYGNLLRDAGRPAEALAPLEQALTTFLAEESKLSAAGVLRSLVAAAEAAGDQAAAADYRRRLGDLES